MTAAQLDRKVFSVSRAADFLEQRALVSQTGQPPHRFGDVVLKELLDNALDACETAGTAPHIDVTVYRDADSMTVTVTDNGTGIPADVVTRMLDFTTLTSDKALYRSPCRGAQGNALKTIIGIPYALGITEPVVIDARQICHVVAVGLDPAGNIRVRHETQPSGRTEGTSVTVPLPADTDLNASRWVRGYALVNPHASFTVNDLGHDDVADLGDSYKATAGDSWRKPLPTDPTSAWWYDNAGFTKLAASLAALGDDRPLGAFVAEFRGLSGTAKRKEIAAAVPVVHRVSDLADDKGTAGWLLAAMRSASTEPKVTVLGQVPESHYAELLERIHATGRVWYKHGGIVHHGVPWHIEVVIAETDDPGEAIYACNYAVSFGDPLGRVPLRTSDVLGFGAASFLSDCGALPSYSNGHRRAVVVHVTCAAPVFTDKGKTQLDVPAAVADEFAKVLWNAGKTLYREKRSAERAWRREGAEAERARKSMNRSSMTNKEAVFAVIPAAIEAQRGGTDLPFSSHSLFYKIRPLFLELLPGKTLTSSYCEQTLIPAYEREHGPITGMYREPRGELHEPHSDTIVRLGTREVQAYRPPDWTYDKILVVEKAGLWPVLEAARLAERFDLAVITSEGFGSVACRELLAGMPDGDVRIFSLHDADHSGYNIARTLGEETVRMPGHHVELIDLGLSVDAAIARGLDPEPYTRDKALPAALLPHLSKAAREWFEGTPCDWDGYGKARKWACKRVELNAFSSPELIAWIEQELRSHDADSKVIPPDNIIESHARLSHNVNIRSQVERIIAELIDAEAIIRSVTDETAALLDFAIGTGHVRGRLDNNRHQAWRTAVSYEMDARISAADYNIRQRVAALLTPKDPPH